MWIVLGPDLGIGDFRPIEHLDKRPATIRPDEVPMRPHLFGDLIPTVKAGLGWSWAPGRSSRSRSHGCDATGSAEPHEVSAVEEPDPEPGPTRWGGAP